jgi:hypothetical protein
VLTDEDMAKKKGFRELGKLEATFNSGLTFENSVFCFFVCLIWVSGSAQTSNADC